MHAHEIAAIAI